MELDAPLRTDITRAVLTEAEVTELAALEGAGRLAEVKLRFSAKEAVYKALIRSSAATWASAR